MVFTTQPTAPSTVSTKKTGIKNLFGRETELTRVLHELSIKSQAICIEGPGGFGKTRLAQDGDQLCLAHIHAYLGGIHCALGRREEAEKQFSKARTVFDQLGSKDGLILIEVCGGQPVEPLALAQASRHSSDIRIARLVFGLTRRP